MEDEEVKGNYSSEDEEEQGVTVPDLPSQAQVSAMLGGSANFGGGSSKPSALSAIRQQ